VSFRDTYILRQNGFPDLNVHYDQIMSPLQRKNEGGHIVLVGLFLHLILFVLKQPCSGFCKIKLHKQMTIQQFLKIDKKVSERFQYARAFK
jgi:hypothetical protein